MQDTRSSESKQTSTQAVDPSVLTVNGVFLQHVSSICIRYIYSAIGRVEIKIDAITLKAIFLGVKRRITPSNNYKASCEILENLPQSMKGVLN